MRAFLYDLLGWLRGMPAGAAANLEAISAHADGIMGHDAKHLHERYSPDGVHIDLLHYPPANGRDFHYIITSGMSDLPMLGVAKDSRVELTIALAPEWDISPSGFTNPSTWEPVRLLKTLARYPHTNRVSFAKGDSVPLGEQALLSPMNAVLLMPPVLVPELATPIITQGLEISFLAVYLLHQEELELKLRRFEALLDCFVEHEVAELYDLSRASVHS
jgi:hypothetical protein